MATLGRDGEPLADVRVSLEDEAGAVLAVTCTDTGDRYTFTGVASGVDTAIASGYPRTASQLVLGEETRYRHDVVLDYVEDQYRQEATQE